MVDWRGRQQQTGFRVGGGGGRRMFMSPREWFLILVCILVIVLAVEFYPESRPDLAPAGEDQRIEDVAPMPALPLDALAAAPLRDPDKATADSLDFMARRPEAAVGNLNGTEAWTLAWWLRRQELDQHDKPLARYYEPDDLLRGSMPQGTAVIFSGSLVAVHEAHGLVWASLAIRPERYVLLVAEALSDDIVIGSRVRVTGRYLGDTPLTDSRQLAVYGIRHMVPERTDRDAVSLLNIGVLPELGQDGRLPPADAIFAEIDDQAPVLEKRPYYWLLGVVSRADRYHNHAYAEARPALGQLGDIHADPSAFRGEAFTVRGYVLDSFVDEMVTEDQPFGIQRVLRVIAWNSVWEPMSERDASGQVSIRNTWVRHAFEIAIIGDEEPPERGSFIEATGRFLKVHGVPARPDKARDRRNEVYRHSDNVYFKFFVADSYHDITPEAIDWKPLGHIFLIVVAALGMLTIVLTRSDQRADARRPEAVRRLRRTRNRLGLDRELRTDADAQDDKHA